MPRSSSLTLQKAMSFDFSSIFFIVIALMALQPLLMGRWYAMRRAQAIRAVEKEHGTRVITMIHRQERRSFFGFAVSRHIDLEDAQTVIAAIKDTPEDTPIDLIFHTPGGIVFSSDANRPRRRSPPGESHRLCSSLCDVWWNTDCTRRG